MLLVHHRSRATLDPPVRERSVTRSARYPYRTGVAGMTQLAVAGKVRRMKSAKWGAVNAISPWRGL
jgi:hypothetical protein